MHKYMDDTTFTVKVQKGSSGAMQTHVNQAVSWFTTNKMIPNVDKTKDMVISFHKQPIDISPICIEGIEIERVKSVKLLGIIVTDKITWNENTTYICSKASKRLYHLKQRRRAGLDSVDLLAFYESVIRSVFEYTGVLSNCPPVGNGVQSGQLENPEQLERWTIIEDSLYLPTMAYIADCS